MTIFQNNFDQRVKKALLLTVIGAITWLIALTFVFFSFPVYLYRFACTKFLAPWWACVRKSNLQEAIAVFSNGCGLEFLGSNVERSKSTRCAIVTTILLEGNINVKDCEEVVRTKLINAVDQTGKPLYPEFQQYIDSWMGFMFWKSCEDFKLANHLQTHTISEKSDDDDSNKFLHSLIEQLINKPFPFGRSPWEVHLVQNYKDSSISGESKHLTAIILRLHHGMADGYSIIQVFLHGILGKSVTIMATDSSNFQQYTLIERTLQFSSFILRLLYDMGYIVSVHFRKMTPWHIPDHSKSWYQLCERSRKIPITKVKMAKNKFGVSFTSVLFSCVAAAFAKSQKKRSTKAWDTIPNMTFLPLPGHSNRLRNHYTGIIFDLPVNPTISPVSRLIRCENRIQRAKGSTMPFIFAKFLVPTVLSYVAPIAKWISKNRAIPSGLTSVNCSSLGDLDWNGRKVVSCNFATGGNLGDTGIGFMVMSFANHIQFTATAESALFSRDELKQMINWVEEELDVLHDSLTQ